MKYGDVTFSTYNVFVDNSQAFVKPRKDVEFVSVAGRNGDLSFTNNRFENIEVRFNCYVRNNFITNYNALINAISATYDNYLPQKTGYQRLYYSAESDIFREAQFVSATEPHTGARNDCAEFEIIFNCKPQKFYDYEDTDSAWTTISSTGTILTNPSPMDALPLFKVEGNGTLFIAFNVASTAQENIMNFRVSDAPTTGNARFTTIDSELRDAYYGNTNRNGNVSVTYDPYNYGFPTLSGRYPTSVRYNGFSSVTCLPRWWRL